MELLLIRHARPERTEAESGGADPPLTALGRMQAAAMVDWLAPESLDAIYTSPMRRARETAEPLETARSMVAGVLDGLAEFDRGRDYYIPMDELRAEGHPDYIAMMEGKWDALGLDFGAFRAGVVETIDGIAERHRGQRVAVVCHGGVINAYAAQVLGIDQHLFFEPAFSGISRVRVARTGQRGVVSLNEAPHLRHLDAESAE